jgi:hypothetical protein
MFFSMRTVSHVLLPCPAEYASALQAMSPLGLSLGMLDCVLHADT